MQVAVDGGESANVDQAIVPEGGLRYLAWLDLPPGTHRVRISHVLGELITRDGEAAGDSTLEEPEDTPGQWPPR